MISDSNPNPFEQEKGCGQHLRDAREAAGLSVDDVAGKLRMPARVVRSLEQEEWQRWVRRSLCAVSCAVMRGCCT
ncbi:hypothetical protein XPR_2437 [Xanthomonas arboricola pv. pruni MAFF 301420]|uniref:HTH cro/C1-type domain-containing protein n=2 Tax=Xanthomonas arboricola pv. pruni TaxID=69929 RepID=W4SHE6_9XANT|nr:hypothetical protein XPU_2441 [Xanthomonas arboricola pv. pruni str. MAFF 311562]GAE55802.1 hypothetical protein XPR_2437 [Xanthomonas arboricola pv. pruni MAFF 301420]GAE62261.1 hypothetical protein XPN_4167 [Xanthomonas arboricola pv. pruni MAFF 301427]